MSDQFKMGCVVCTKSCTEDRLSSNKGSLESLESKASDNKYRHLTAASQEGVFPIEEPKAPRQAFFDNPGFTTSIVIYFNNTKQRPQSNPYIYALEKTPEVYLQYFTPIYDKQALDGEPLLHVEPSMEFIKNKEWIEHIKTSDEFQRHLKMTTKLMYNLLGMAVTDDLSTAADSLKRIGAKHAELGIPAKHIYAFRESFMHCLEQTIDPDKEVFRCWAIFIRYMVHMIIKGMNDHYNKIKYVYWSVQDQKKCWCFPSAPVFRPKLIGIDADAVLSLRNMAATIEAMQD
ncbi:hypothetical protein ElyMa_002995300 [Elysia marginata]|uniref:Globin family profile domain-containing protein n=1 Tax=Elysia marginata TaxID=1093978 RepID=A0AAV4IBN2_9GAST|nr:hypothetical protein ElyMa_002995300 [Elysia marginata]